MKNPSQPKPRQRPAAPKEIDIKGLGQGLVSSLNRKSILQELAKGLKSPIPYDRLTVFDYGERKAPRRVFVTPSHQGEPTTQSRFNAAAKRISARLAREKRTFNWHAKGSPMGAEAECLSRAGFNSYLALPLIHRRRVIGSFHLARKGTQAYTAEELRVLDSVSHWLTMAMGNALLYQTVKSKNEALQEASEYKSQFLARMSDEIRTHLGVLVGFLDILHAGTLGPVNEEQRNALDKMQSQSRKLQKMINDVLNQSRIEEGSIPLEVSTFAIERIIEPQLPTLTTDAPKREEILQNLIVNAFKYTPEGEVRIRIKNKPEFRRVEFVVENRGLGISQKT